LIKQFPAHFGHLKLPNFDSVCGAASTFGCASFNFLGAKSGFLRQLVSTSGLAPAMNTTASCELIAELDTATRNGSPEGKALFETLFVCAAQHTIQSEARLGPMARSEPPFPAARAAR